MMKRNGMVVLLGGLAMLAASCAQMQGSGKPGKAMQQDGKTMNASMGLVAPGLRDGELAIPDGYRTWPVFLSGIDKPAAKQIRDIYINPKGHSAPDGGPFPVGTMSVMEIWKPRLDAVGKPVTDADGKMIKESLSLVFAMGKSAGAGALTDKALSNGDWVYAGYQADGKTPGGPAASACRACHLPQADNDFVFRADEYFKTR